MNGLIIGILVALGFIGALLSWAWILQSLIAPIIAHWGKIGSSKRVLISAGLLLILFVALQSLGMFDKHFTSFKTAMK